jgi:hypothetical protein
VRRPSFLFFYCWCQLLDDSWAECSEVRTSVRNFASDNLAAKPLPPAPPSVSVSIVLLSASNRAQVSDSYLNARTWNDLITAVHRSNLGFPADKLVELCHENEIVTTQIADPNVDRLTYNSIEDILNRLNSLPSESVRG